MATSPSGLYWDARSPAVVRVLVNHLSRFSDWMAQEYGTKQLNPWRQATRTEEQLAWAAWQHQRNRAFLGHTMSVNVAALEVSHCSTLLKKTPSSITSRSSTFRRIAWLTCCSEASSCPASKKSPRIEERLNLRDILITMLMHYGGLRVSEPFHLFIHDVIHDDTAPGTALVRSITPASDEHQAICAMPRGIRWPVIAPPTCGLR